MMLKHTHLLVLQASALRPSGRTAEERPARLFDHQSQEASKQHQYLVCGSCSAYSSEHHGMSDPFCLVLIVSH